MVNISTGHKAKSATLVRACGKGMGTGLVAAEKQAVINYPHKTGHICRKVSSCFVNLLFLWSTVFAISVLGAIPCMADRILFQKV